ncbi:hypothetical protein SGRIM128S_02690 [Streptomyces griseomycini]
MTSTASSTDTRQDQAPHEQRPSWQQRLRRFGYSASGPRGDVRDRLVPPYTKPSDRLWAALGVPPVLADRIARWSAWGGPLLVTLLAGVLRFWNLGSPKAVIFDETYYAKDAWALVHRGFEVNWDKKANDLILSTGGSVPIPTDAAYVVHPPVGKYVIGLGELMFGFTPFGWRFMTALLGTLSVLLLCRIGRRLFRSTFLGCLAGALMAVDGLHFVMSRTSLLDGVLMFFVLAAFGCLVVDRDRARERLAAALPVDPDGRARPDAYVAEHTRIGFRPWRLAAGLMLGLAIGTKWNGLYITAAFCVMAVLWDVGARRVAGAHRPRRAVLRRDLGWAFLSTVPVAVFTYFASWIGWILSPADGFQRIHDVRKASLSAACDIGIPGAHIEVRRYFDEVTKGDPSDTRSLRFVINRLAKLQDDYAVSWCLDNLPFIAHIAKETFAYLAVFKNRVEEVQKKLVNFMRSGASESYPYLEQRILRYFLALDLSDERMKESAWLILEDRNREDFPREFASRYLGRSASVAEAQLLRHKFEEEPNVIMRRALLMSLYESQNLSQRYLRDVEEYIPQLKWVCKYLRTGPNIPVS